MSYSLNTTIIKPISNRKPKNIVILCHGYGGDGKDISILANYWKNYLPETMFLCPDAPEKCAVSSQGFQWFAQSHGRSPRYVQCSVAAHMAKVRILEASHLKEVIA